MPRPSISLTGKPFGRLMVVGYVGRNKHQTSIWRCDCECGKTINALYHNLTSGRTKSCGCLKASMRKSLNTTSCGYKPHGPRKKATTPSSVSSAD